MSVGRHDPIEIEVEIGIDNDNDNEGTGFTRAGRTYPPAREPTQVGAPGPGAPSPPPTQNEIAPHSGTPAAAGIARATERRPPAPR